MGLRCFQEYLNRMQKMKNANSLTGQSNLDVEYELMVRNGRAGEKIRSTVSPDNDPHSVFASGAYFPCVGKL